MTRKTTIAGIVATAALAAMLMFAASAIAERTMILDRQFGRNVNLTAFEKDETASEDVCTVESGDVCRDGTLGPAAGEFGEQLPLGASAPGPSGLAVDQSSGDVYVLDQGKDRVQKFNEKGEFLLMFGREVNETTGGGVCLAGEKCKNATAGAGPDQFDEPDRVVVEPSAPHDVYITEGKSERVDKYGPNGEFILTFGGEVNETKDLEAGATEAEKNVCTAASKDTCKAGVAGTGNGQFSSLQMPVAVGGPAGLVYVGDTARVQEFEPSGAWKANVSTAAISVTEAVSVLAVEPSGDLYVKVGYVGRGSAVQKLDPSGGQIGEIDPGVTGVTALAIAPSGDLALMSCGSACGSEFSEGFLYGPSGEFFSTFGTTLAGTTLGYFVEGVAYNAKEELYAADDRQEDVLVFKPAVFPESFTGAFSNVQSTAVTLTGEVNPAGVDASSFFEYGPCAQPTCSPGDPYGLKEPTVQSSNGPSPGSSDDGAGTANVPVEASIGDLVPNQSYHYRLLAENDIGLGPLGGGREFTTPALPPQLETLKPSFVSFDTAGLNAVLNPEHSEMTYWLEYGPCETPSACEASQYTSSTPKLTSSIYGTFNVALEIEGLAPASAYHYRLVVEDHAGTAFDGENVSFTTAPLPALLVTSGAPTGVTQTAAVISATLETNGVASDYGFQIGTQAGVYGPEVGIGSVGEGIYEPTTVTLALQNLQPGTTYHYRLLASNVYNAAVYAPEATFTTVGGPSPFTQPLAPPLLAVPPVAFPVESEVTQTTSKCKRGQRRDKHGKCVKIQPKKKHKKTRQPTPHKIKRK